MKRIHVALIGVMALLGCRGGISDKPPVHLIPDMDWQPKYGAQMEFKDRNIFADGRAARPLVEDTVPVGQLREDDVYFRGKSNGQPVAVAPIEVNEKVLERGQSRYNIYCAPCHSRTGSVAGIVVKRSGGGFPPPPDLAGDVVRGYADGHIFDVISNGIRNMPGYAHQIPVEDRWAIVSWVRVLGRSQHGSLDDVPPESRNNIAAEGGTP